MSSIFRHNRLFLLGATSIVGSNIVRLQQPGIVGIVTSRSRHRATTGWPRLKLDDLHQVRTFCDNLPSGAVIIYCDAVCDVSKCQENPPWAREINIGNLQRTLDCLRPDTRLVYVSSDHVFGEDGRYDESSAPCPVSIYGEIRAAAERLALTWPNSLLIRYGLPIGPSLDGKSGHLDWLNYRLTRGLPVTIIQDESRTAMPSPLLAERIVNLVRSSITGTRHISATRLVTRVELATALKEHMKLPGELHFSTRKEQPAPHLGRIHVVTKHTDQFAEPLLSPLDDLDRVCSTASALREGLALSVDTVNLVTPAGV